LDLDADPVAIDAVLGADPHLATAVAAAPGRRVPRSADGDELAIRAVLGQQISTAAARTHAARLVRRLGSPLERADGTLTHLWPATEQLVDVDPADLAVPAARRTTFTTVARALARGEIDLRPGADWDRARIGLAALPGVGPWTVETIAMRALGDPDAFLPTDLGVRTAADQLGLPTGAALSAHAAAAWRPWRAYAVQHLWGQGSHAINRVPA